MSEADREDSLAGDPPVGKDADEVLGRERLEHRDKELDGVLVLAELLLQQEELMVEDVLSHCPRPPLGSRMPLSEGELSHSTGILGSGSTPSSMLTS